MLSLHCKDRKFSPGFDFIPKELYTVFVAQGERHSPGQEKKEVLNKILCCLSKAFDLIVIDISKIVDFPHGPIWVGSAM